MSKSLKKITGPANQTNNLFKYFSKPSGNIPRSVEKTSENVVNLSNLEENRSLSSPNDEFGDILEIPRPNDVAPGEQNEKSIRIYTETWFVDHAVHLNDKSVTECVLCRQTFATNNTSNMDRHLERQHPKFVECYPKKTEADRQKRSQYLDKLLTQKNEQRKRMKETFGLTSNELVLLTSFKVAEKIAVKKKPFQEGEFVS